MKSLNNFRNHILDRIVTLQSLQPQWDLDQAVIDSQAIGYRTIIWEIDNYIEELADEQDDKLYYLNDPFDENLQ